MASCLKLSGISKCFQMDDKDDNRIQALEGVDLTVEEGEFICIVGASGCGKSTLLRIIAGLEESDGGSVMIDGREISGPGNDRGLVFQEPRLFPWLNVGANIEFGLSEKKKKELGKKKVNEMVDQTLDLIGLKKFKKAYPYQLSGGMQQRISIGRSLIENPRVLLLDEPLGALDALTRMQMQNEILRIWKEEKTTMVLVTHDIDEAIYLGDRVVVLSKSPGTVKTIVPVDAERPRDRSSLELLKLRQQIYKELFEQ